MKSQKNLNYFIFIQILLISASTSSDGIQYSKVTPPELIKREGFEVESHSVTTEDGYILTLHRIPGPPGSTPVFMNHGIFESSAIFLLNGKTGSLALLLRQRGYDVWLGNARGTIYSRGHKYLSTSDPKYWDYGLDEIGTIDTPAMISYVHNKTNKKMFYVGHSMGGATFALTASERPDIAENIKAMFGLAPAVFAADSRQPLFRLGADVWELIWAFRDLSTLDLFGRNILFNFLSDVICPNPLFTSLVCDNIIFLTGGYNRPELPKGISPQVLGLVPAGVSIKQLVHILQQIQVAKLRHFNYPTAKENLEHYNSTEPPEYDLSKVQPPVAVFYSHNDRQVGARDVLRFYNAVPNKLGAYAIEPYTHFDFVFGRDAPRRVYSKIFKLMSQFE